MKLIYKQTPAVKFLLTIVTGLALGIIAGTLLAYIIAPLTF